MKSLRISLILILVLVAGHFAKSKSGQPQSNAADTPVANVNIEAKNINQALAQIAYKYNVPISLEAAADEDLLKSKRVTVQVTSGKIANVLDRIVQQKPEYTWEANESGVRVFPRSDFRDSLLQTVLELRIGRFVLPKRSAKLTFRQTLAGSPELKRLLASYGVKASNEAFSQYDIAPFGDDFSLNVENTTVRSILDRIIKDSPTKYWFIKRDGENKEYLLINF